jgi:aminopeptidase N
VPRPDPHSFFDDSQPRVRHLRLALDVDFGARRIEGETVLELTGEAAGPLDLDTKGLEIRSVSAVGGAKVPWELGEEVPVLGRRLRLTLPGGAASIAIRHSAPAEALGLQWLDPAQTEGKRHPFAYTQFQSIHARTVIPVQDSPSVRVTYHAEITVPEPLAVVMSAGPGGSRAGRAPGRRTFAFDMPQPIPAYLIALAAGDLVGRDLSPRSRVWAEPGTVEAAAWEFAGAEEMIARAESLFGPYEWDRYDMLVLPPAFPYGGMENPRMTFLTPTVLAGDRSLVDVVAHELAHSWTGNIVTNATMDHFWLNEGFTTWAERRIQEALHGADKVALDWAIGQKALDQSVERFGADSPFTRLRTDLAGVDPDDAYSSIPYEKGSRLVCLIERTVGRPRFDRFVRSYIARFRFTSITSEQFLDFLEEELPGVGDQVEVRRWLYEPGVPANAPVFESRALEDLTRLAKSWGAGARPTEAQVARWTPAEMQVYLQHLPRELDAAGCAWLDATLKLSGRGNYEILTEWLTIAGGSDYEPVFGRLREVLVRVGRMKYLRPLYTALGRHARTQALARDIFEAARAGYHALSRRVVQQVFEKYPGIPTT